MRRSIPRSLLPCEDHLLVPLGHDRFAKIDVIDGAVVGKFRWFLFEVEDRVYATRQLSKAALYMHRFVTDAPGGTYVDHRNGDTLDNRRQNLRVVSGSMNNANRLKKRGTSRFKGVSWDNHHQRWAATIALHRRNMKLLYTTDEVAAAQAYDAAARELFGEFAALNFPASGERSCLTGEVMP